MVFQAVDPAQGRPIRERATHDPREVEERLDRANVAFAEWRTEPMSIRRNLMHRLAGVLQDERAEHAARITAEMGKPVRQAEAEIDKCVRLADHYAEAAPDLLATEDVATEARQSYVRYDPLGPVLAIMPWNFPYWQTLRFAVPALMAGNVAVVKPPPNTPGCAEALEEAFRTAGFPKGVLSNLFVPVDKVEDIVHDDRIAAVTFTGSPEAGSEVAEAAADVTKPCVLELGGSDPFIVLDDADLDRALDVAVLARCQANGQSCIAAKRFLVESGVHEAFVSGLVQRMGRLRVGDPMDPETDLGPLARGDLRDTLHHQVTESVRAGATLRLGGEVPDGPGYYYPATVMTDVRPGMRVFDEETFGPVAAVSVVADEDEAVRLANASRYGLGATIWSGEPTRAEKIAGLLDVGNVAINGLLKSDPRLPFGGVKASGYGRELGRHGLLAFVNVKSVTVAPQ